MGRTEPIAVCPGYICREKILECDLQTPFGDVHGNHYLKVVFQPISQTPE